MTNENEMIDSTKNTAPEEQFVADLRNIASEARRQAYRSANQIMVIRNWLIVADALWSKNSKETSVPNMASE